MRQAEQEIDFELIVELGVEEIAIVDEVYDRLGRKEDNSKYDCQIETTSYLRFVQLRLRTPLIQQRALCLENEGSRG